MILKIKDGLPKKDKIFGASKSSLAVFFILIVSALTGKYILNAFGISIFVFNIVGGIIISYIGFGMLSPGKKQADGDQKDSITLFTLIMFAASPGTIATVITVSTVHDKVGLPVVAIVGVCVAVLVTWLVMLIMIMAAGHVKRGGQQIVTRFMGIILIAMGLQFALTGLKDFFTQ